MTSPASPAADGKRGGPPPWFLIIAAGSLLLGLVLVVLAALGIGVRVAGPGATLPPTGQPADITHALVTRALETAQFQVRDPLSDYRPPEGAGMQAVPRRVVQAILPEDPAGGNVVIYELADAKAADEAGRAFLRFLGSGTGAINYPRDTKFVLQRVGPTLIFFAWSAEASPDARVAELAAALQTVGAAVQP
jgi:hypothetical protein